MMFYSSILTCVVAYNSIGVIIVQSTYMSTTKVYYIHEIQQSVAGIMESLP